MTYAQSSAPKPNLINLERVSKDRVRLHGITRDAIPMSRETAVKLRDALNSALPADE
jgi:hypothetical protein